MVTDTASVLRGPRRPDLLRDERLADIVAATANAQPAHPALVWEERVVSYRELHDSGWAIGRALARRGARPGAVVGVFFPRGANGLIAQVGVTCSGAAWLPFDPDLPIARLDTCLRLANAIGVVTPADWVGRLRHVGVPIWPLEELLADSAADVAVLQPQPTDPAYVMFTSGSTGEPKGIAISQRSICHFLRSENAVLDIGCDDRVYQGFSVAFDMSFEEIWISYLAGATVWIAPAPIVGDPDAVAAAITRERITVLHAVPTMMDLVSHPLPTVRLINLGGEACPAYLPARLTAPGRRLFNSYGPTEATVTTTIAELRAGEPIAIGMPIPNYGVVVLDADRRPARSGEAGELGIFGPGLALEYIGRADLTAERFVVNPAATGDDDARIFLTGDLARIGPAGLEWIGRADDQIKIRGYRVELGEIRQAATEQPGVATAAVVMRALDGVDAIVAFVVPAPGGTVDTTALRRGLMAQLPRYMVPAHVEVIDELPRLTSGKIDLRALRARPIVAPAGPQKIPEPRTNAERILYVEVARLCPGRTFDHDSDFFDDLGGHSLLVARLVSALRHHPDYVSVAVQDVYRERRLAAIARAMDARSVCATGSDPTDTPPTDPLTAPGTSARRWWCGVAQAVAMPGFVLINMADWLAPFIVYHLFTGDPGDRISLAVLYALLALVAARGAVFAVAILGKRLLAGRLRPGRYPLWSTTYYRAWLSARFVELPPLYLISGTVWYSLYLRALGARVGRDVIIDTMTVGAPELLTIDDGVSIGTFVNIENARVERGMLILGPVRLHAEAVVETYAVVEDDTSVGRGGRLCAQSALGAGQRIPDGAVWDGAPARPSTQADESLPPRPTVSRRRAVCFGLLDLATAIGVTVLFFLPAFPAFMLIDWIDVHALNVFESNLGTVPAFFAFLVMAVPGSVLFVAVTIAATGALRWLLPRQSPGTCAVPSVAYWRKRLVTAIIDASLDVLHGLFASVFAPLWLRCLGATVGRRAEVSTAEGLVPDLLTLGDETFVGDGAVIGDEELRGGWMRLKPTTVGARSFVGNGAYVPDGTDIPDDVLIGVQTRSPRSEQLAPGQTWLGSPPMRLPAREAAGAFPDSLTFHPSPTRRLARGAIETLRIVLPLAVIVAAGYSIVRGLLPYAEDGDWWALAVALAVAGLIYGAGCFLGVAAIKWIAIGRYRPRTAPMWTLFVWISEAVTNVYESLAVPNFLNFLRGTPMLPWALRLLGVSVGRGVFVDTTDFTEFDCVRIGDGAELNAWCGPQTHLFEDRVMKIGTVDIGDRVTIGARSTILYGAQVGDDVRIGPLTLVAKGEQLPAGTRWEGTPAAPARRVSGEPECERG